MEKPVMFHLSQRVQALIALTLVVFALLLLGGLSNTTTSRAASTYGVEGTPGGYGQISWLQSMTGTLTHTLYFPLVRLDPTPTPSPTPTAKFSDDFSNPDSGWIVGESGDCKYEYRDGVYRITVDDEAKRVTDRCVAFKTKNIIEQDYGTYTVKVRRISSDSREAHYGFYFGAGSAADEDHWFLEVHPYEVDDCDGSDRGYFWLSAVENDKTEFFDDVCTSTIKTNQSEWNTLTVVRTKTTIDVYINGSRKGQYDKDEDVDDILRNHGFFNLVVAGFKGLSGDKPAIIEFDDLVIND